MQDKISLLKRLLLTLCCCHVWNFTFTTIKKHLRH